MKLYDIDEAIMNCFDIETGEITDEETLEEMQQTREEKLEGVALWIKDLAAESKAVKDEIDNLKDRKIALDKKIDGIKGYLAYALDGNTMNTSKVVVSYRKSKAVYVENENLIPIEYWKQKDPEIDKAAIKKALTNGEIVSGCELEERNNMSIK